MSLRKEFKLPEEETEFLETSFPTWETIKENRNWVLLHDFPIPDGYNVDKTIAAIQVPVNYPVAKLDMVYFYPFLKRSDGKTIPATQCMESIDGKQYQRWSRHYNTWDPQNDSLVTHVMAIEDWLIREFRVRC